MKNSVRALRKQQGWTQEKLAQTLQVSRQTVNAIENQRYDPSLSLAFTIARAFDQSIESIFNPE